MNTIIYVALELIRKVTILLYPIIPSSSLKVLEVFGIKEDKIYFETIRNNNYLRKGLKLSKLDILFKKIEKNDKMINGIIFYSFDLVDDSYCISTSHNRVN